MGWETEPSKGIIEVLFIREIPEQNQVQNWKSTDLQNGQVHTKAQVGRHLGKVIESDECSLLICKNFF